MNLVNLLNNETSSNLVSFKCSEDKMTIEDFINKVVTFNVITGMDTFKDYSTQRFKSQSYSTIKNLSLPFLQLKTFIKCPLCGADLSRELLDYKLLHHISIGFLSHDDLVTKVNKIISDKNDEIYNSPENDILRKRQDISQRCYDKFYPKPAKSKSNYQDDSINRRHREEVAAFYDWVHTYV